jgi:hypothetical protein
MEVPQGEIGKCYRSKWVLRETAEKGGLSFGLIGRFRGKADMPLCSTNVCF